LRNTDNSSMFFIPDNPNHAHTRVGDHLHITTAGQQHTTVRNTLSEVLEGGHFYQYTVTARIELRQIWVGGRMQYWEPIRHYDADGRLMDEPSDIEYGISFSLTDFTGQFTNLTPQTMREMPGYGRDGWVELTFFIRTEGEQDLNLEITFGNEWRRVFGVVEILSTQLEEIDLESWELAQRTAGDRANIAMVTYVAFVPPREPSVGRDGWDFDFLLWPSIIMAVAILYALGAVLLRRYKLRIHLGKRHTSYAQDEAGVAGAKTLKAKAAKPSKTKTPKVEPIAEEVGENEEPN